MTELQKGPGPALSSADRSFERSCFCAVMLCSAFACKVPPGDQDGTRESLDFGVGPSWGPDIDISLLVYLHTTVQRKLQENHPCTWLLQEQLEKRNRVISCVYLCVAEAGQRFRWKIIFSMCQSQMIREAYTSYCQWSVCVCVCAIHVKNM